MELKQCPKGHFYDASVSTECPICQQIRMGGGNTIPLDSEPQDSESATVSGGYSPTEPISDGISATWPTVEAGAAALAEKSASVWKSEDPYGADDGKTIGYVENGVNPVVGWLVSLTGSRKGQDYRIHADNNYIGRSEQMDICIRGDDSISRVNHAVLAYDARGKSFYFGNGEGRSLVRLNNEVVLSTVKLKAYDVIEIGRTRLIFIPLCGEGFDWDNVE
ncbi:MAG: FHA domain-containing protein [Lachnospiraceae bacterium]|nr:FHA domain-containing protein [Lachnospiraceae bacterium]MCD7765202.1 FHA domain-containing protein [Lachnospiraceae bacterium]